MMAAPADAVGQAEAGGPAEAAEYSRSAEPVLTLDRLSLAFGGLLALSGLDLRVDQR
jgi:hypothetical protein